MIEAKEFGEVLSRPMTDAEIELLCDSEIRCAMLMHTTCVTVALPAEAAARAAALYEAAGWSVQIRRPIKARCVLRLRSVADLPLLATLVTESPEP